MALMVGLAVVAVMELPQVVQEILPLHLRRKATMEEAVLVVTVQVGAVALVLLEHLYQAEVGAEMEATVQHLLFLAHL
jgi:hypothetical protein